MMACMCQYVLLHLGTVYNCILDKLASSMCACSCVLEDVEKDHSVPEMCSNLKRPNGIKGQKCKI